MIKSGDKVKIIKGKDKGKIGKVLQIFPLNKRASVEGLNLLIKHLRPRKQGEHGQRIEFPAPLNISNLMLVCPKCGEPSKVGFEHIKTSESGKKKKIRVCKKCKQNIE